MQQNNGKIVDEVQTKIRKKNIVHHESECVNFPIVFVSESYVENHLSCLVERDFRSNPFAEGNNYLH